MDPINDLVWTEEDGNEIMLTSIGDGPGMVQACQISLSSCSDDGSGNYDPWTAGGYGDGISCGC